MEAASTPTLILVYLCANMNDPVVGGNQGLALRLPSPMGATGRR